MEISEFLNEQYNDSCLYMNYRSTPSYIDGLKNSARKIVYTIKKQNIKSQVKVSALGSKIVDSAGYLHGDTSIQGAIITMAQNFCGSNNLPILEPIGSFGTRHIPEAAAPRYIFVKPAKYFDYIFRKEDEYNLIEQEFEGEKIEPIYYVPTLPMVLVNGSIGIGIGFATTILPRNPKNIIQIIYNFLSKEKSDDELFKPYWNNFKGEINYLDNNKWEIKGKATLKGKKLIIEEVPISYSLTKYLQILRDLKEKGIIERYTDFSENDEFKFEIVLSDIEKDKDLDTIMKDLKLVDTISENLVCIDENNAIKEFTSIKDIFKDYCKIKISYLNKRIKSEITRLTNELDYLINCFNFVSNVVNGKIDIRANKNIVEKKLKENGYKYIDKLLSMPIYSLTNDKVKELEIKMNNKQIELDKMKKETPITVWTKDLKELEEHLD